SFGICDQNIKVYWSRRYSTNEFTELLAVVVGVVVVEADSGQY
ncbi:4615_t:CDS:2, partial [Gigaspora rosea]